jgi:hypothetical protein
MRCLRTVLVVGIAAVFALLCRAALVFSNSVHSNNNTSAPRSGASSSTNDEKLLTLRLEPAPEAVMVAVHIKQSGGSSSSSSSSSGGAGGEHADTDTIERLAVQRLAKDDGVEFSGAAAEEPGKRRRVIDAHVIFENDRQAPRTRSEVESWLGGLPIKRSTQLIEASRATERAIIGKPFDVFSGICGAGCKLNSVDP